MSPIDKHALYELDILRHVEQTSRLNNRQVSGKLGVSVKLAHEILKRMVRRGLLHVTVVHARRWDYFLTPQGIVEKTRLTLEFLDFSMHFYREARRQSAQLCRELSEAGSKRVAFLGAGDLAEITYLGVQEWGLQLGAVYADGDRRTFMTVPVQPLSKVARSSADALIVCLYDKTMPMRQGYLPADLAPTKNMRWIFDQTGNPR